MESKADTGAYPTDGATRLELSLTLTQTIYRDKEPIVCTLILTNEGESTAVINGRMLLSQPMLESEIYFVICDRKGHSYAYRHIIVPRPLSATDFIELPAGDEWAEEYDLRDLFGLAAGQSYLVQAFYRNQFAHPNRTIRAWVGKLASNQVEFVTT